MNAADYYYNSSTFSLNFEDPLCNLTWKFAMNTQPLYRQYFYFNPDKHSDFEQYIGESDMDLKRDAVLRMLDLYFLGATENAVILKLKHEKLPGLLPLLDDSKRESQFLWPISRLTLKDTRMLFYAWQHFALPKFVYLLFERFGSEKARMMVQLTHDFIQKFKIDCSSESAFDRFTDFFNFRAMVVCTSRAGKDFLKITSVIDLFGHLLALKRSL